MVTGNEPDTLTCARHPDRATLLRCGKCDTPICVACAIQTPVGARCAACAHTRPLPTYQVGVAHYLRGSLAGAAVALVGGALIGGFLRGLFAIWLAPVFGWLVGEAVARAANERRGRGLQVIAAVAVVAGAMLGPALPAIAAGAPPEVAVARAVLVAGGDLWVSIFGLVALFFAIRRLR